MIQGGTGSLTKGRVVGVYGSVDQKRAGQIRLNVEAQSLVRLARFKHEEHINGQTTILWRVRDILSGKYYDLRQRNLGSKVYNEMEVLAWASTQS
jgi:hypothetical protein